MSDTNSQPSSPTTSQESLWQKRARQTSRKINIGWWLQTFNTPVIITSLGIAALVLSAIYYEKLSTHTLVILGIIFTLSCCAFLCWLTTRKKFESTDEALVRLEDSLKLENSLSAAKAGIIPWPDMPLERPNLPTESRAPSLNWHLPRTLLPSLLALLVIIASFFIPVGSYATELSNTPTPENLTDLEAKLELLDDDNIVQEDYLEEMEQKVEELKQQDSADWFSHSSLEAIDNLAENHEAAAKDLSENLNNAERALQSLQKHGDKLSQTSKENLLNEFGKAVENLDTGNMKPNKELLDQLKQLDPEQLNQLTPEQLNQLRENMRKMASKLKQQQGNGEQNGEPDRDSQDGEGDVERKSDNNEGSGKGDIQRGPGHAPQLLGKASEKLELGKAEKIEPNNLENTLPGDLLETTDGEHEADKTNAKVRLGGNTKNKGKGGERVWKSSLLPDEKKALKNFFK